jgi:regulatory protein
MPLKKTKSPESAQEKGFRLLGRRDYSCEELRKKLAGKDFSPEETEGVIAKLKGLGLLDDQKLARRLVDYYSGEKLWGPQKVFQKLVQRGIDAEAARGLVRGEEENGKAPERLRRILHLKTKGQDLPALSARERLRLAGFLRRRGYGWDEVWEALRETGGSVEE